MLPVTDMHRTVLTHIFNSVTKRDLWEKTALAGPIANSPLIFLLTKSIEGIMFMLVSILTL